jgi:hypothetical protein
MSKLAETVFKPRMSAAETKSDTTTRVAREIHDAEVAKREAKTERLRLARLAAEADAPAPEPKKKPAARKKA